MRHFVGIVLAIAAALVLFFAGGWGYLRLRVPAATGPLASLPTQSGSLISDHNVLAALGALLATGLTAGVLIAAPRISPLAAGLPGLALLALTGLYLASVRHAVQLIPLRTRAFGAGFEDMLADGVLAMAGLAMIIPLFVPSRWRRRGSPANADDDILATGLLSEESKSEIMARDGAYVPQQD
ncbi:MAG TPA: hypothetical protein VE733_22705 [Streptosporangiaceae bacterium]|nr:hypothetical protein [Streptosporangiaceae bacterium]